MTKLTLTISDSMAEKLKNKASEMKTDINELVNMTLEKFFFFQQVDNIRNEIQKSRNGEWRSEAEVFTTIS